MSPGGRIEDQGSRIEKSRCSAFNSILDPFSSILCSPCFQVKSSGHIINYTETENNPA
jgi:hypothetical protein